MTALCLFIPSGIEHSFGVASVSQCLPLFHIFHDTIFYQKLREEIFGPVTVVSKFSTEKEAIDLANDTKYGLCATLWSENISRANRVAKQLKAGTVWTNCWLVRDLTMPFGRKLIIKIFN